MLPHPQIAAGDAPGPTMDKPMIGGQLINVNTGRYMGALPLCACFRSGRLHGSTYVGWAAGYKLILVHFPEQ